MERFIADNQLCEARKSAGVLYHLPCGAQPAKILLDFFHGILFILRHQQAEPLGTSSIHGEYVVGFFLKKIHATGQNP
jgi:hypothetical protein